jgi:adenylate cyclase
MWMIRRRINSSWSFARGAWVAVLTAVAGLLFLTLLGGAEEAYGLGILLRWRGSIAPPPDVVVIGIGANPELTPLKDTEIECWPRALHAPLVRTLADNGAAAILFDLFFRNDGPDDEPLLKAMRDADRVIIMRKFSETIRGAFHVPIMQDPAESFAQSAFAVSAPLFSIQSGRVTRMRTFDDQDNPMAPAIALQLATRDIAQDWDHLLATVSELPPAAHEWADRTLVASMKTLRAKLKNDRAAGERLAQAAAALEPGKAKRLSILLDLYRGEGDRLLNFRGPAGTISNKNYWSFTKVSPFSPPSTSIESPLSGGEIRNAPCPVPLDRLNPQPTILSERERQEFQHKLVLIGATGNLQDTYETAFSPQVSGVEILANALGDLAEGKSIRSSPTGEISVVLGVALAVGLAAAAANTTILAITVAAVALTVFALGFVLLVSVNTFVPVFTPTLVQLPTGVLLSAWTLWHNERKTRRSIEASLAHLFPQEMAQQLLGGQKSRGEIVPSEMRSIVCLATDAEGFTTVSERLSPDALRHILLDYISALQTAVRRHGGAIADISGDGLICYWLADTAPVQARADAIMAALDMLDAVAAFNARHPQTALPTRFGLYAGKAAFGSIAGGGFFAPMLVGDVVNTAARMESLNKVLKSTILASEDVCMGVTEIVVRRFGAALLKGRKESVQTVEIMGRVGQSAQQSQLAERFTIALDACRSGMWTKAVELFEDLQRDYPEDGPTKHFLEIAFAASRSSPPLSDAALMIMDKS